MMKYKMVQHNLLKNSIAAYFSAIEIHNKPNIRYRYEITTLLIINAWELLLKAFIKKYVKNKSIYTKDGNTISLNKALDYTEEYLNLTKPKIFIATKENLRLIEEYRNNVAHYYNEEIEPCIFMLTAKAIVNFTDFIKEYFSKDILAEEGLFILPLGFKLPFSPEDFLTKNVAKYASSPDTKRFIDSVYNVIIDLDKQGVEDSIVVGFDIYLENINKVKNSDLIVAITSKEEADVSFSKVTKYRPSNDPNALKISISDDEILLQYPLSYEEMVIKCKKSIPKFKQGKVFNNIMKELKLDKKFSFPRRLNPKSFNSSQTTLYSESIIEEIKRRYKLIAK